MSELTRCNYCSLREYLKEAKDSKQLLTLLSSDKKQKYYMGGFEIYIHPKNIDIKALSKKEQKQYWKGWFMDVSDHCVC